MKKLYLCKKSEAKVLGVCGGIADYFNVDPTLIRIATALVMFSGAGLIAYIVCGFVIPKHPDDTQQ